jgi:hypothetical protein
LTIFGQARERGVRQLDVRHPRRRATRHHRGRVPGFDAPDRVGAVVREAPGGQGASTLVLATVTAIYAISHPVVPEGLVNLAAWGANCARIAVALGARRRRRRLLRLVHRAPTGSPTRALHVLDPGLAESDSPISARRAARLLQSYELLFWDALADELP